MLWAWGLVILSFLTLTLIFIKTWNIFKKKCVLCHHWIIYLLKKLLLIICAIGYVLGMIMIITIATLLAITLDRRFMNK